MSSGTSTGYLTALTVSVSVPDGTLTVILSPFFLPTRARPTGDSTEMRPADGAEPRREVATTPEEALEADAPPAPCPQCGWSTMWSE